MNYLIIIYALFLLGFLIYSAAGIYHLWRFGYSGDMSKVIIFIYSIISVSIIIASLVYLSVKIVVE
jgi:hypothetical protein